MRDFRKVMERKDVDVVICGTVDHWHTLVSLAAMRAGKDVYCEKPLTLTIDEGKRLVAAQAKTKRILQTGSQQRSDKNFRLACELVRNGRLGKIKEVDVWLPAGRREGPFKPAAGPEGSRLGHVAGPDAGSRVRPGADARHLPLLVGVLRRDDDRLGRPPQRHRPVGPRPRRGPVKVSGKPLVEMIPSGFTASSEYDVEYTYADGVVHRCRSTTANAWNGGVVDAKGQQHGVKFVGADGWIFVTRGKIEASDPELLKTAAAGVGRRGCTPSNDHMGNFFECVRIAQAADLRRRGRPPLGDACATWG